MNFKAVICVCAIIVAMLLLFVLISGDRCGSFAEQLDPNPPQTTESKGFEYFDGIESHFAIPVTVSLADARAYVISKAPPSIPFNKEKFHIGPIWVKKFYGEAHPKNIRIQKADTPANTIAFDLDFSGKVTAEFQLLLLHPVIGADISGHVKGTISAAIDSAWKLTTTDNLSVDVQRVHIEHLGDIASHVRGALESEAKKELRKLIEKAVNDASPHVKQAASEAWTKMHLSQKISESPPAWVTFKPTQLSLSPLQVSEKEMGARVGIAANTRAYVEKTPPTLSVAPLPALVINSNLSNHYNLILPVQASVDELLSIINASLRQKAFQAEDVTVFVSKATADATSDNILVAFDFCASRGRFARGAKGRLYATGHINYEQASDTLSLSGLDYTLESAALLRAVNWILKPKILEEVTRNAKLNVAPLLEKARKDAERQIASMKTPHGIKSWKLTITPSMKLLDIRANDRRFFLLVRVEGETGVEL